MGCWPQAEESLTVRTVGFGSCIGNSEWQQIHVAAANFNPSIETVCKGAGSL